MSRYLEINEKNYPILIAGFLSGGDALSANNKENEGRDKRPGKDGGEIARGERAAYRKILSASESRDLTDDEITDFSAQFEEKYGHVPSVGDIEKITKPLKLKTDPYIIEFSESEYERLLTYFKAARWTVQGSLQSADMLDLIEECPKKES